MTPLDDVKKFRVVDLPGDSASGSMAPIALFKPDGTAFGGGAQSFTVGVDAGWEFGSGWSAQNSAKPPKVTVTDERIFISGRVVYNVDLTHTDPSYPAPIVKIPSDLIELNARDYAYELAASYYFSGGVSYNGVADVYVDNVYENAVNVSLGMYYTGFASPIISSSGTLVTTTYPSFVNGDSLFVDLSTTTRRLA